MKNIYLLMTFLILISTDLFASTSADVKVLESSEEIRLLSQKISREYLMLYKYPNKKNIKKQLNNFLDRLDIDFKNIARTTKDSDTKDVLEFLAYSKDQIADMFKKSADKDKAALMLDYSETLLEGADSIAKSHLYEFSKEEKMLMATKEIKYLLERIGKYYMALNVGFADTVNKEKLNEAVNNLEKELDQIRAYKYPSSLAIKQNDLIAFWDSSKSYYKSDKLFIPNLLQEMSENMEKLISQLAIYHSKNQ